MKSALNYFIIHGSYGNPYKNWIPWLKRELSKRKINCIVPNFPNPYRQDYESWSKILKAYNEIGYITEDTTFVTHSLGGIFIIKFLIENDIKVKKIITVAGFNNVTFQDDMNLYSSFYLEDNKLLKINSLCEEIICIYSDNDLYVPQKDAEEFANRINSEKIIINNAGHFNEKFGYTEFKELLKCL